MKNITSVVKGNVKMGENDTWNVNLPPHKVCTERQCFKEGCCYNFKAWRLFPSCRKSWLHNWNHYLTNPTKFFDDIIGKISRARKPPQWFRWQAAGEIPDQAYFEGMKRVSAMFPGIKFLAFTKNFDLSFRNIPENLQIVASAWPGIEIPENILRRFPIAWMVDDRETRHTRRRRAIAKCTGHCPSCRICWSLGKLEKDVAFLRH